MKSVTLPERERKKAFTFPKGTIGRKATAIWDFITGTGATILEVLERNKKKRRTQGTKKKQKKKWKKNKKQIKKRNPLNGKRNLSDCIQERMERYEQMRRERKRKEKRKEGERVLKERRKKKSLY